MQAWRKKLQYVLHCSEYHIRALKNSGQLVSRAAKLLSSMVAHIKKRFPTDFDLTPPAHLNLVPGLQEETNWKIKRLKSWKKKLSFCHSDVSFLNSHILLSW